MASRRRIGGGRDFADDALHLTAQARVGDGRSITQCACIGMARCTEHACHRAALHDASEIHHRDTRAEPPHGTEIVTDEYKGQAAPCLQFFSPGQLTREEALDEVGPRADISSCALKREDARMRLRYRLDGCRDHEALSAVWFLRRYESQRSARCKFSL